MKKFFVFGTTALARVLFHCMSREGLYPDAFVIDDEYFSDDMFCDIGVVPYSKIPDKLPPCEYDAYVAVGYARMNGARQEISKRLLSHGYSLPNYIHPAAHNDSIVMGCGNLVFAGVLLDAFTRVGDCNIFYPSCTIAHDTVIGSYNFFTPRVALAGDITVGDRCFFGLNCSCKNGVHIEDRCFLGAASYASDNLKSGSVLVPSRSILLDRDSEDIIEKVMRK